MRVFQAGGSWQQRTLERPHTENSRGIGVLDMAEAIRNQRAHRASGELACHVLEVMHAILKSAEQSRQVLIHSRVPRPEALSAEVRLL